MSVLSVSSMFAQQMMFQLEDLVLFYERSELLSTNMAHV